ncbi:LOW QUALITY PROTEIN: von Willebrand factor A domain-containing protein 7-like [Hypomesus transpacificus]|uniref:LOW QUALITY PROTEIN: von Willebrand factor A domain-containing protein 7-like n=1 Tax=Hypomesus transpacificus TaxID=137520 RepID=UPI001F078A43|nr:LOW QUALITY PROTEIN: von Willebrand factor A domain-containing protein 7-like [Hypomesus transpacificus]
MTSSLLWVALCLLLPSPFRAFKPLFSLDGESLTHRQITVRAVLRKTAEACQSLATAEGRGFSLTIDDSLTVTKVQSACSSDGSALLSFTAFHTAVAKLYFSNALVDVAMALSEKHHFDDEAFSGGRDVITSGVSAVKESVKAQRFLSGRLVLGWVCHTLQDFYSHSNWVELGNRVPYTTLIRPDLPLTNLADPSTPTCRNCVAGNCNDNILSEVLQQGLLTSGYFNLLFSAKPAGKCSHGGSFDQTSGQDAVGGINKDDVGASHGHMHQVAAEVAVAATTELLEDIRAFAGDRGFLRLMGLSQSSVLCFVIDTTGSMKDDIAEAKRVSFSIIDSKRGSQQEPSAYILVPFNDPGFGPLLTTTDADIFKQKINELQAKGGGDIPELCLSGLQVLALTGAPPSSEIFVVRDAPAKDAALKSTVPALIESTKSVVTFMLTDNLRSSRRRRRDTVGGTSNRLPESDAQLYRDLARASGGQAIEVTKAELPQATSVIQDASGNALVTVLQVSRTPGKPENFTFTVDSSIQNLTVYITGGSLSFAMSSPTGVSQNSQTSGPLGTMETVGNLRRISLNSANQTGSWEIRIISTEPYTLKVIGQSSFNFIYSFVEAANPGAHGDFSLKEGRPLSGANASLLVTVTGSDTATVSEVSLVDASGSREVNGTLRSLGEGSFLVTLADVPEGEFVVRLRGEDSAPSRSQTGGGFQRQASTQVKTSSFSVTAVSNSTVLEPGSTVSLRFTVTAANGTSGTFAVRATNDRGFVSASPATVTMTTGGTAEGTVTLTAPASTASGTDITVTIEMENTGTSDTNYAVLQLSVVTKITDFTPPQCQAVTVSASNCPVVCSHGDAIWELSANVTDGNGTGVDRVTLRLGNGTLNTSTATGAGGENVTVVSYTAPCCSDAVELVVIDRAGNVGRCAASIGKAVTATTLAITSAPGANVTGSPVVAITSSGGRCASLSLGLGLGVAFCLLLGGLL